MNQVKLTCDAFKYAHTFQSISGTAP